MGVLFGFCFGRSLERLPLILAALFLWITLFLAALSAKEIAAIIFSFDFCLFATLMAISSLVLISLFTNSFLFELRRALFAVWVTGMLARRIGILGKFREPEYRDSDN